MLWPVSFPHVNIVFIVDVVAFNDLVVITVGCCCRCSCCCWHSLRESKVKWVKTITYKENKFGHAKRQMRPHPPTLPLRRISSSSNPTPFYRHQCQRSFHLRKKRDKLTGGRTDSPTDGRTDGWRDGWTDGWTEGHTL